MKNKMWKKALPLFAVGAMVTGIFGSGLVNAGTDAKGTEPVVKDQICEGLDAQELSLPILESLDETKINDSKEYTAEEKAKLLKANSEAKGNFEELDKLFDEIDKKMGENIDGADAKVDEVYKKIEKVFADNGVSLDKVSNDMCN